MGRFIQQQIKTLVSRFIPTAWCPKCGNSLSLENSQKKEKAIVSKRKKTKKEGK